jgi:hypothetical protein
LTSRTSRGTPQIGYAVKLLLGGFSVDRLERRCLCLAIAMSIRLLSSAGNHRNVPPILRFEALQMCADITNSPTYRLREIQRCLRYLVMPLTVRGLFINDEEPALTSWWANLYLEFYAHVFDLLLLKANYIWPAMWASSTPAPRQIFFTNDPGNTQLADDYGIVVSTGHY